MFYTLITTLTTFLWLLYWYFKQKRKFSSLNKIPGPTPLPILGSVFEFGSNPVDMLNNMRRMSDTFGAQVKFWIGPINLLILSTDPEMNELILNLPKYFKKGKDYKILSPWLGNGLLLSTGSYWQKRRKIINPAFHFKVLDDFVDVFNRESNKLIKRLAENIGNNKCDIYPYITACTLDIICETAMGATVKAQDNFENEYVNAVKKVCHIIMERGFSSWKRFDSLFQFSNAYRKQQKYLNIIHGFTKSVIEHRRQTLLNTNSTLIDEKDDETGIKKKWAFLDVLLQATVDGKPLSDEDIREEVDTFMFAGHDTSASMIAFAIYELARNPEIQNKVFTELREIYGNDKSYKPKMQDLNEMKYTELVLKEVLRLYPSVPFISRILEEDLHFNGTTYPKDLQIVIFIYAMQRRSDLFREPDKFNPDRFLVTNNPFAYIPFSAGPRNCIGQKFAMYEAKTIISKIIMNFELLPSDEVILSGEGHDTSASMIAFAIYELARNPEIQVLSSNNITRKSLPPHISNNCNIKI